LHLEIF